MKLQTIFSNFLCVDNLSINNSLIETYAHHLKNSNSGLTVSNQGGWHSDYLDVSHPAISPLFSAIDQRLLELHKFCGFKDSYKPQLQCAWININKEHNFNSTHNHPGSVFSGVYYVKAPNHSGAIKFLNPINEHTYTIKNSFVESRNFFNSSMWTEEPKTGKVIFFPSWLLHYVEPNCSTDERISIAFNYELIEV